MSVPAATSQDHEGGGEVVDEAPSDAAAPSRHHDPLHLAPPPLLICQIM